MATTGKGSKIKFTINVTETSLGGKKLTDNDVSYKVEFYAKEKKESAVSGICAVSKGESGKAKETDYTILAVCDTTALDLGTIYATVTINYTDGDGFALKEMMTLTSDVKLVEVPEIPSN